MADTAFDPAIVGWMRQNGWGMHHLEWHTVRQWDRLDQASRDWAAQQGWRRAAVQEGEAGNGLEFLAMHRAMIELLREQFPNHGDLFRGWSSPPTDPNDRDDPLPNGAATPFPQNYLDAITKLRDAPGSFASDDKLGQYIETRARPVPGDPFARDPDTSAGIHNFLHNRFSDSNSPIDMGNPLVNIENARFWRLHGWIDRSWTASRTARGLSDTDPQFRAAIDAEKAHLTTHAHHHAMMAAAPIPPIAAAGPPPASILHPFTESAAREFHRLMATTQVIDKPEKLLEFIQAGIRLELFTLPLYLAALWSIKPGKAPKVAAEIKAIAMQEMLHMGLMCNLMVAVGGKPRINTSDVVPIYPGVMPGILDSAVYSIEALTRPQLKKFLAIEMPQHGEIPPDATAGPPPVAKTIGDFYDLIAEALVRLEKRISTGGKLVTAGQRARKFHSGDSLFVIREIGDPKSPALGTALYAIRLIKEQGEGTEKTRGAVHVDGKLAHYYRFQQIDLGVRFDPLPDGRFAPAVPDPSYQLPPPNDIFGMAPVPPGGYHGVTQVEAFDRDYSDMLDTLQEAWASDSDSALDDAVNLMYGLRSKAQAAMRVGTYGPDFRYLGPASAGGAAATAGPPPPAAASVPGYARIQQILDDAVEGRDIGGHRAFWRMLSRDQFVAKSVFGRKLIATRVDGTFDPDESNLVKALEGRPPFGSNLNPPPDGALFEQMPIGFPPVPADRVAEIRGWITAGCPAQPISGRAPALVDEAVGGPADPAAHVAFWHDFDDWAMFHATDEVRQDIETFFGVADAWLAAATDPAREPDWAAAVADAAVRAAVGRLEARQRQTVIDHYGRPVPLLTLLDSFERFGDDSLPDDPDRPQDRRHRMNGAVMWFYWSAFVDACLRSASPAGIPAEFWRAMARGVLLGLLNDGVFRPNRYTVKGFTRDDAGKQKMRDHVRGLGPDKLAPELARRYSESGLGVRPARPAALTAAAPAAPGNQGKRKTPRGGASKAAPTKKRGGR
jgi:hypothetical protein